MVAHWEVFKQLMKAVKAISYKNDQPPFNTLALILLLYELPIIFCTFFVRYSYN